MCTQCSSVKHVCNFVRFVSDLLAVRLKRNRHLPCCTALNSPATCSCCTATCRCLVKGQTAVIEVTAARSLVLEEYSDFKALGRIALREGGRTVAVGVVTQLLA